MRRGDLEWQVYGLTKWRGLAPGAGRGIGSWTLEEWELKTGGPAS